MEPFTWTMLWLIEGLIGTAAIYGLYVIWAKRH